MKRVALARAIATRPPILFLDEPTTGLDPITATRINMLIRDLVSDLAITALAITHDMASVRHIADHVAMLHQGRIIWTGPLAALETCPDGRVQQFITGSPDGPLAAVAK